MIRIDTLLEWLVVVAGVVIALSVLYPDQASKIGKSITDAIPDPTTVNEFLKRFGL